MSAADNNLNQSTDSYSSLSIDKKEHVMNNQNVKSNEKNTKTINMDSTNFDEYVTNGKLNDKVNDGDTLDIQGKLDNKRFALEINKPVNMISSNGGAYMNFERGTFKISERASGSNITGIKFNDTHISIENVSNLKINNISTYNGGVSGYGSFTIRDYSNNITVTNSYFKTENNGGISNVVFAGAYNCLFENNTVIADGTKGFVGNVLYLTTYNAPTSNKNITLRNNLIRSINTDNMAICYGLALEGTGHIIEGNIIDNKFAVMAQYSDASYGTETIINQIIFNNNTVLRGTPQLIFQGIVSNNTFFEGANLKQVHAYNNKFNTVYLENNVNFEYNIAKKVIVNGDNNTLNNNEVFSDEDYAITIYGQNTTLENNQLASFKGRGNNAISTSVEYTSVNNSADISRKFYITEDNLEKYFVYNPRYSSYDSTFNDFKNNDLVYVDTSKFWETIYFSLPRDQTIRIVSNSLTPSFSCKLELINSTVLYNRVSANSGSTIINSTIYDINRQSTLINSTIIWGFYGTYPHDNTYVLIRQNAKEGYLTDATDGSRVDVYTYEGDASNVIPSMFYVNHKYEMIGIPHAGTISTNVTFIEGSMQSTVTGITFKEKVFVNDSNIKFINCTFNDDVEVNAGYNIFEGNIFNSKLLLNSAISLNFTNNTIFSVEIPVNVTNTRNAIIENNIITTTADNTIVFDDTSRNNIVRNNILKSNSLYGNDTVQSAGNTVESNTPSYDTKIFITANDVLFVNSDNEVNISVKNVNKDVLVDKGYVEVYLDGIYTGTYNLTNGQVTINPSTNKVSLGEVRLKVWYYDGITYSNNVTSIYVNVSKANVAISVEEIQAKLNENTTVKATFIDQQGKYLDSLNATFTIGRTVYNITIQEGIAKLEEIVTTEWLDAGKIKIDSPNTDKYNSNTTTIKLDVEKGDINVESDIDVEAVNAEISMNLTNILNENITDGTITITTSNGTILAQEDVTNGVFNRNVTIPYGYKDDYLVANYADSYYYKDFEITFEYTRINNSTATIDEDSVVLGDTTTITAKLATEEGILVDGGEVIFKVNGKTLRDNDGNVIYVEVKDGEASIENINVTREWLKPDTYIQAVYVGNDEFESFVTQKTNVTVTKPEATITITSDLEAKAGDNITLSASVTDNELPVNSGRVVFKLNGKTLKDENGKALYVDVKDGVATTKYMLPVKTKAKTYNLTAVFTDTNYDRSEAEADFVVTS